MYPLLPILTFPAVKLLCVCKILRRIITQRSTETNYFTNSYLSLPSPTYLLALAIPFSLLNGILYTSVPHHLGRSSPVSSVPCTSLLFIPPSLPFCASNLSLPTQLSESLISSRSVKLVICSS